MREKKHLFGNSCLAGHKHLVHLITTSMQKQHLESSEVLEHGVVLPGA